MRMNCAGCSRPGPVGFILRIGSEREYYHFAKFITPESGMNAT